MPRGPRFLRAELPGILAKRTDVLSLRMLHIIEGLAEDWHRLDERIEALSSEIGALACKDPACDRLMSVPGIGPIISSAMVAANAMFAEVKVDEQLDVIRVTRVVSAVLRTDVTE